MKKEKLIIGLTTIVLSLLIFIQELAISLYRYKLNNNNTKLIFSNDIYFFIGLFAIGLFVVLSRNFNNIIFTLIAIIAYLIFSILGIKNFNSFGNNLFYSIITLIYSILLSIGLRNKQIIVKEKLV